MLDRVKCDLEHDLRSHHPGVTQVLHSHVQEAPCERRNLRVGQPGVRLADVDQLAGGGVLDRERVVGEHSLALAVSPFDRGDDHVQRREWPLQLEPRQSAAARRVGAERVLDHEALVAALAGLCEDPVQVGRIGRLLEPRQQEGRLEAQAFKQLSSRRERFVKQRSSVEPQHVEDDEHHRNLSPQLVVDLLAAEPALQLEETQNAAVAMCQHLAVEQNVVANRGRSIDKLGESSRRFLEVAREQLHARLLAMQLAAHAIVLFFRPDGARAHALERPRSGFDRAREHEADRLKQSDGAGLELAALAKHRRLADVTRHKMHALDLCDRDAEPLADRGFDEALAEPNAHLAGDDLHEKARGFRRHAPE